jgi:hypothetical protein
MKVKEILVNYKYFKSEVRPFHKLFIFALSFFNHYLLDNESKENTCELQIFIVFTLTQFYLFESLLLLFTLITMLHLCLSLQYLFLITTNPT